MKEWGKHKENTTNKDLDVATNARARKILNHNDQRSEPHLLLGFQQTLVHRGYCRNGKLAII